MTSALEKRALVLLGAGAACDFGAPSTGRLTELIEDRITADDEMKECGGDRAYLEIARTLEDYYKGGRYAAHFERIYHCAHELLANFDLSAGAEDDFRPALFPFIERKIDVCNPALRELVRRMATFIYRELSAACESPRKCISPLTSVLHDSTGLNEPFPLSGRLLS